MVSTITGVSGIKTGGYVTVDADGIYYYFRSNRHTISQKNIYSSGGLYKPNCMP